VNQRLTGLLLGQTLQTTPAEIYRALIEATAFGARAIIERLREYGVPVERVVCTGGIATKNPLLMQIYADVTGCEMHVSRSTQSCALGAAIGATVAAGIHGGSFAAAQNAMTGLLPLSYKPDPAAGAVYDKLYALYRVLHDAFGGVAGGTGTAGNIAAVMPTLLDIKAASAK